MNARYRLCQGIRALVAWFRPVDDALAAQYLTPPLYALYRRMGRSERQHSLRVLRELIRSGRTQRDLLTAALLHDVGKTRQRFLLPEKVLVVLVKAAAPGLYEQWGSSTNGGWRRPFAVSVQHPAWGAEMVAAAGGSPLAVELIRRHQDAPGISLDTEFDHLLCALQTVDNRS